MKKLPDRELLCYSYIAFRPWNHLERAKHHWNCAKRYFVLFVGRRYYLRPIIPLELREAHNLSAERSVRAGNRSCSAIRGFLCVRVLVV